MTGLWIAVLAGSLLCFAQKWLGHQVPRERLETPRMQRLTSLLPIALLGALVAVQTAADGTALAVDARLPALALAALLLALRAPFLLVVIAAAACAALLRALGWG